MKRRLLAGIAILILALSVTAQSISGELRMWHKISLDFEGPEVSETDDYNPFMHFRLNVVFRHEPSGKQYTVPGFFAADGNAANSSADRGNIWRVNFSPDAAGPWSYRVSFRKGRFAAVSDKPDTGESGGYMDGLTGELHVSPSDKTGRDFRAHGRLQYAGEHFLKFAGTGEYFLKNGVDAPENLLAYAGFDGGFASDGHKDHLVKNWEAHVTDWQEGDPVWQGGKGKGLIGAVNYIASEGLNAMSFLTMNIGGDDRNVFPYIDYDTHDRMDVSKLAQWEIVFEHAQRKGIFLHFKTQESENQGLLDNGGVGALRKLYYRELIARFGHHLALNWNLGEENGDWARNNPTPPQFTMQRLSMARYFYDHDPYHHHIVIHNGNPFHDLLGPGSKLTGPSIQTHRPDFSMVHGEVLKWRNLSAEAGKPWACSVDEPGDAQHALLPDADAPNHDNARKNALWGAYMAGAWGIEWYFGYQHDHSDLTCQDFRSRDLFFDQCRRALEIMTGNNIPYWRMEPLDSLVNPGWCLARPGSVYLVYLPGGRTTDIILQPGQYGITWIHPRKKLSVQAPGIAPEKYGPVTIGNPPEDPEQDWLVLIRSTEPFYKPDQQVFSERGGLVAIEAEDQQLHGNWKMHQSDSEHGFVEGFTGKGCIQFTGNSEVSGPPGSPLVYRVRISTPGQYSLAVRALEAPLETGEGDKANDCYIRLEGQDGWEGRDVKHVLLGPSYRWSWNITGEPGHHDFHFPVYTLEAGVYELVISGRSKNFFIDKLILFQKDRWNRSDFKFFTP